MTRPLSVAHLTALDLPPPAFIEAAARAGFDGVGLRLLAVTDDSPGYPLRGAALRATQAAMAATGLAVRDIEFLKITPDLRPADQGWLFDMGADLGARHLITAPYDPDPARLADRLAALAEMGQARGLGVVLEFFPWTDVPDLAAALQVLRAAGPGVQLLVDSLHLDRSGSRLDDLARVPPGLLAFAHLCDAPVAPPYSTAELLTTAQRARRTVVQNLAWAVTYNAVMVPLAFSGVLVPWIAALGMGMSSLVVVANSLRLSMRSAQPSAPMTPMSQPA